MVKTMKNIRLEESFVLSLEDETKDSDYEDSSDLETDFKKILSNEWGSIIKWSINLGNHHFAITLNTSLFYKVNNIDSKKVLNFHEYLESTLVSHFPTMTWFFIISEENIKQNTHFHLIVAVRSFIDYNYTIKNNLTDTLINSVEYYCDINNYNDIVDVKVESLKYFKDVKNWVMYMHKDISKWKYKGTIHSFSNFIQNKENLNEGFTGKLMDVYAYYIEPNRNVIFYGFDEKIFKHSVDRYVLLNLTGVKLTYNKINQRTLINILQYYLILNEYFIYNDGIYQKVNNSKISYKFVGTLIDILYNKFQENVIFYFITNFESYFKGFDFSLLIDTFFIKSKTVIESIKDISTQRIQPDFSLIEFTDGVYSIKHDRFFSNNSDYVFNSKITTIKHYNKSYGWNRKINPDNWISGLKNALGIEGDVLENEDFIQICKYFSNVFHRDTSNKKSTLLIHGVSNSGKTTLISNVLAQYFGDNNIGSIVSAKNFKWQDLIGKMVAIMDEGRYNSSMSSDLLKITGQERIIVEKKYSKEHIIINPIPLFILTNTLFEDKDISIDDALKNRMYIVEFINEISKLNLNNSNTFKTNIKDEEANIILYCNKLLFKLKKYNKAGRRISNEKIIKMIENK